MLDKDRAIEIIDTTRRQYELKPHEVRVYAVLLLAANGTRECSPTVGEIAELCERSRTSVRRAIRSLEDKGLLIRETQYYEDEENARAPNKYILRIGG
ncbi:MAG: helix-turn-helix domain-containing protein [Synergistaceae bacterium]|jgi:predicted transcriptional regulator|nr:helix-turn-helix domain-containing protein [Synergistaceae bacterium]